MSDLSSKTKKRSQDEPNFEHSSGSDSIQSDKSGCTSGDACLVKDSKRTVKPKLSKLEAFDSRAAITGDDARPKVAVTAEAAPAVGRNVFNTDTIRALMAASRRAARRNAADIPCHSSFVA